MVETITRSDQYGEREERYGKSGYLIMAVQKDILKRNSFPNPDGSSHEGFYLQPMEIIELLETFLPDQVKLLQKQFSRQFPNLPPPASFNNTKKAERIIEDGWVPLTSGSKSPINQRRSALNTLLTFCESRKAEVKKDYEVGRIGDKQFRKLSEPLEGIRLSVISETDPKQYDLIVKSRR